MPIYEYECNHGHTFEVWEHIGAATVRRCTVCKARARRVMSVAGWSVGAVSTPGDFRDRRRESDYDRKLAAAFPMHFAIDEAAKANKQR
jgi:putative FmdB family regulatory protein